MTILIDLGRRGALTELDRNNALSETRDYLSRACDPPRGGLGPSI